MRVLIVDVAVAIATLIVSLHGSSALAASPVHHTYPQPVRAQPSDPMRQTPSENIPDDPDRFLWRITNKVGGKAVSTGAVRVFGFDEFGGGGKIGEIAAGTTVRLIAHRRVNRSIFYAIPFERVGVARQPGMTAGIGWVEGFYIEVAGMNPNPDAAPPALAAAEPAGAAKTVPKSAPKATKASAKATPAK